MAKRRKIAAPSAAELNAIEEEFRRETRAKPQPGMAPIAQVASETAHVQAVTDPEARVQLAHDMADAKQFRAAQADGRIITDLPLSAITADALVRDRTVIDTQEMDELKASIRAHGLRLPIEVFSRREGSTAYALLSGYRRLRAFTELYAETGVDRYKAIPCLIRDPDALGGGFVAMVEENEIRASLSHYERGRIAVIAAQRGAFADTEAAVAALFHAASKAKRSKIRSFAVIFEELGDLLSHAESLKERDGLRLATALRAGAAPALRAALEAAQASSAQAEWAALAAVLAESEKAAKPARTGRPKSAGRKVLNTHDLPGGARLQTEQDASGFVIRLQGQGIDAHMLEHITEHVKHLLAQTES